MFYRIYFIRNNSQALPGALPQYPIRYQKVPVIRKGCCMSPQSADAHRPATPGGNTSTIHMLLRTFPICAKRASRAACDAHSTGSQICNIPTKTIIFNWYQEFVNNLWSASEVLLFRVDEYLESER